MHGSSLEDDLSTPRKKISRRKGVSPRALWTTASGLLGLGWVLSFIQSSQVVSMVSHNGTELELGTSEQEGISLLASDLSFTTETGVNGQATDLVLYPANLGLGNLAVYTDSGTFVATPFSWVDMFQSTGGSFWLLGLVTLAALVLFLVGKKRNSPLVEGTPRSILIALLTISCFGALTVLQLVLLALPW